MLGAPLNLSQRLESGAPVGGILISPRTRELLDGQIRTQEHVPVKVKGIDEPLEVYVVPVEQ